MDGEKKKWVQPELAVLVRSKPEENVLHICKVIGGPVDLPGYDQLGCDYFGCSQCTAWVTS